MFLLESVWNEQVVGEWKRGLSAGGSRNDLEMFARNPQFLLTVDPPTTPTAGYSSLPDSLTVDAQTFGRRNFIPVLISLKQLNTEKPLHIAFFIYTAETKPDRLDAEYFLCVPPVDHSGIYVNSLSVERRCSLKAGQYVVVSAAFFPEHAGSFLLTVSCDRPIRLLPFYPHSHHRGSLVVKSRYSYCTT
ncbi:hypothetical protein J6590_068738 [Homalodisca vitripennis]|nr:hypothetical protein J6590_068738 [Homalodisca vitripennis]